MNLWPLKPTFTATLITTPSQYVQVDLTVIIIIYWYILTCTCACALCSNQSEMSIESIGSCFLKLTLHATLKRAFNCSLVAVLMDPLSLSLCVTDDVIMLV